jgi:hypothetical protein
MTAAAAPDHPCRCRKPLKWYSGDRVTCVRCNGVVKEGK